jgi:hypothetical protein
MTSRVVIGIPWYRREDWARLKTVLSDAAALHENFEDWEREAVNVEWTLRLQGNQVERVVIDVTAFGTWCLLRGRPTDAAARSEYALETVQLRDSRQRKDDRSGR